MTDRSATSADIYHNPHPITQAASSEDTDGFVELVKVLRSREDNGRPFWNAVLDALNAVPDQGQQWNDPPPPRQPIPTGSVVYYLRFADRVKIGTTINLANRLTVIPHDEVLATEPGGRDLEGYRHQQFADDRLIGEWFELSDRLREHIATL